MAQTNTQSNPQTPVCTLISKNNNEKKNEAKSGHNLKNSTLTFSNKLWLDFFFYLYTYKKKIISQKDTHSSH